MKRVAGWVPVHSSVPRTWPGWERCTGDLGAGGYQAGLAASASVRGLAKCEPKTCFFY